MTGIFPINAKGEITQGTPILKTIGEIDGQVEVDSE